MKHMQYVKKAFASLLLITPLIFTACGRSSGSLFLGNATSVGGAFGGNGSNGTNNSGSIDVTGLGGTGSNNQQNEDAFFARCSQLGDISFKIAEVCGPLVNSLYNPDVEDAAVKQQFRQTIGSCYQAFQIMYEPYCHQDLQQRIQNGVNVCVTAFKNAPWQTIADEINNWDTVYRQATTCANGLKNL